MIEAFSATGRSALLAKYRRATKNYNSLMDAGDYDSAKKQLGPPRQLEAEYFKQIPNITICPCPFDGKPLFRSFDPFGLDGLWWRSDASLKESPSCPHFCCMRGAVNFDGQDPQAGDFEVHPGPEVPYVIPRLLEYEGVVAVISQIEMENGYIAYPIAYFAERRPQPELLTAGWARTIFVYTTQFGISGWRIPNDLWDFDLMPWLKAGKIRWCPPDSDNTVLSNDLPELCPYLNIEGKRQITHVQNNHIWYSGLPDGTVILPMD